MKNGLLWGLFQVRNYLSLSGVTESEFQNYGRRGISYGFFIHASVSAAAHAQTARPPENQCVRVGQGYWGRLPFFQLHLNAVGFPPPTNRVPNN